MPSLPTLPGLDAIGDISNAGNPGPSQARQQGDIEGASASGPVINIATGGGSVRAGGNNALLYAGLAGLAILFVFVLRK